MSKDVKVEVIYYKAATDISLEFGLHGRYPLRLLSSDCNDINTFFQCLKRAVSRSEIIITVGGFGEQDNLPGFIARATGLSCYVPDLLKQNIISDKNYCLPKGAIPLAPKSRRFAGYLLECGPQSIIGLTDDKKTRLEILEQFVVNYITEHHKIFGDPRVKFTTDNTVPSEDNITPENVTAAPEAEQETDISAKDITTVPTVDLTSEPTVDISIDDANTDTDNNIDITELEETDETSEPVTDGETDGSNAPEPPETDYDSIAERARLLTLDIDDEDLLNYDQDIMSDDGDVIYERHKTRHKRRIVRIICLVLSLVIIAVTGFGLWLFSAQNKKSPERSPYYSSLHNIYYSYQNNDLADSFDRVKAENPGFLSWLCLDGSDIDHPVLSVPDITDKQTLLTALPDGTPDRNGTLFSTTAVSLNNISYNAVIYGSASEGGIFDDLYELSSKNIAGSHITAADNRYFSEWEIFSVFSDNGTIGFDYLKNEFSTEIEYAEYLYNLKQISNSSNKTDITFIGNEKILLLVGIKGNENYCFAAKLVGVRILSDSTPVSGNASSNTASSFGSSFDTVSSEITETQPNEDEDLKKNDFLGESPDLVISLPSVTSSSAVSSSSDKTSSTSSDSSSETSTEISASTVTSREPSTVSSTQSNTESTSSEPSTTASSTSSKVVSSVTSSNSKPDVDPIYTWDIQLSCIDSATGIKYTADAVTIVAMIIEDEMSPTIDPPEALIAQAIVKYNWLLNNNGRNPDKAPQNALDPNPTEQALKYAAMAKGNLLLYENTIAKTYCYAYSAGKTANYQDIWGGTAYPYLQSVDCSVDEDLKNFITTKTYSADEIKKLISSKCGIDVSSMPKTDWIKPVKYDNNNLYCVTVSIGGKEYRGQYLRDTLLSYGIRSSAYTVTYNEANDTFTFTCKGYGHGVGFSQCGANAYAKQGWDYAKILAHFFPGTTLVKH